MPGRIPIPGEVTSRSGAGTTGITRLRDYLKALSFRPGYWPAWRAILRSFITSSAPSGDEIGGRRLALIPAAPGVVGPVDVPFGAGVGDRPCRNPAHARVRGHIVNDHRVGADGRIVADLDAADDLRPGRNVDIVADDGATDALTAVLPTERYALGDIAVIADDDTLVHENAAKVPDIQTAADLRITGDVDPIADRVVTQQQYRYLARPELPPPGRARVRVESQQYCVAKTRTVSNRCQNVFAPSFPACRHRSEAISARQRCQVMSLEPSSRDPMRILHLIDSGGVYGAERVLLYLAREQQRQGHSPAWQHRSPGARQPLIEVAGAIGESPWCPIRIAPRPSPAVIRTLLGTIQRCEADVVHSHGYKANILLGPVAAPAARTMLATLHGWTGGRPFSAMWMYERMERWAALPRIDSLVVVTRGMLNLRRLAGLIRHGDMSSRTAFRPVKRGWPILLRLRSPTCRLPSAVHTPRPHWWRSAVCLVKRASAFSLRRSRAPSREPLGRSQLLIIGEGPQRAAA